jgi:teichuronic acid biosynthesis glycosyltransferase TuaH
VTNDAGPAIVYSAAVAWDGVPGSDRRLAERIAERVPVIWVDPPVSLLREFLRYPKIKLWPRSRAEQVAPGIVRLRAMGPPGVTRPLIKQLAEARTSALVRRLVTRRRVVVTAVIGSVVNLRLRGRAPAVRVYYATDDFVAGASLMGTSAASARSTELANLAAADLVFAVTQDLADKLAGPGRRVVVLPNGCEPEHFAPVADRSRPTDLPAQPRIAGVVGQLNERIDPRCLAAVADRGIHIVLVGPRTERSAKVTEQLDELFEHPNIHWLGSRTYDELPAYLAAMTVGLTPYLDTEFNRSSFPLKTLEYLSAGLPVVSTDLPAARSLETDLIEIAGSPEDFADRVEALLTGASGDHSARRRAFAAQHSWRARADTVLAEIARVRDLAASN